MSKLSRRNFFRVLPAAPVAVVAASSPSFDEQLAATLQEVDARPAKVPGADTSRAAAIRRVLDGRYLVHASRIYVSPEEEAEYQRVAAAWEPPRGIIAADESRSSGQSILPPACTQAIPERSAETAPATAPSGLPA